MKRKIVSIILLISILLLVFIKIIQNDNVYAGDTEVYDVILFWGQSNMVGCVSDAEERFDNYSQSEVESFAKASKIDEDILYNTTRTNYTKVEQQPSTVYEYKYLTNRLEEINANSRYFGENLKLNTSTAKLERWVEGCRCRIWNLYI